MSVCDPPTCNTRVVTQAPGPGPLDEPGDDVIRAAGGVVWRLTGRNLEIVVVHRPKYNDWSLPKGKLDPGETWEQAAVREVVEETGLEVELGRFVGQVEYIDPSRKGGGRPKVVRYWAMKAIGGAFAPNHEVDELRWLPPDGAPEVLTHSHDRAVVDQLGH